MRWRLIRLAVVIASFLLLLRDFVLFVQHAPLEDSSIVMAIGVDWTVLEGFVVDAVDDGNGHDGVVAVDWGKEWRKPGKDLESAVEAWELQVFSPILVDFTMRVKVDDDFARRFLSSPGKSSSKSIPNFFD
jgi:hypothetical protein